jgi:PAS domain S-box-containing protein
LPNILKPKQLLVQHLMIIVATVGIINIIPLTNAARLYTGVVYAAAFILLMGLRYGMQNNSQPRVNFVLLGGLWLVYTVFALLTGSINAVTLSGYVMVMAIGAFLFSASGVLLIIALSAITALILFALRNMYQPYVVLPEWVDLLSYGVIFVVLADTFSLLMRLQTTEPTVPSPVQTTEPQAEAPSLPTEPKVVSNLRETAEQLRIIFDEALDIFIVIDNDERIVRVNAAVTAILGYTPDELLGRNFSTLLPSDNINSITDDMGSNQTLFDALHFVRKDGSTCPMELTATIIPWENDMAILITLRDVSKHEELRRELEVSKEQVQYHQDLTEARLNLIFMVAHQLRNPLSIILTSTEIIERYMERMDAAKRLEHLGKVKFQTLYLRQMMNDMLAARDAMDGKLQCVLAPLHLQAYCQDVFDTFVGIQTTDKHIFTLTFQVTTLYALLDKTLLNYMLDNLLTNAVKYSPSGGNVQMTVVEMDNQFVIAIADEGIGVPAAAREKLFDMFYRADNVSAIKGTGIGLGLAYMSAKAHGGTITCESTLGKGSTFYIRLPLVPVNPNLIPPSEKQ